MIKRFFSKILSGLDMFSAVRYIAFLGLFAQFLGFIRDRLLVSIVGVGSQLDVYYASFKVPDILFVVLTVVASPYVLLPLLGKNNDKESTEILDTILGLLLLIFLVLGGLIFVLMPELVVRLFPGFNEYAVSNTVKMSRVFLISPLMLAISSVFLTVNQKNMRFILYSISPVLYNLGLIVGVLLYPLLGLNGLMLGVVLAVMLHAGVQVVPVLKHNYVPRPSLSRINYILESNFFGNSVFRVLASSIITLTSVFFAYVASTLGEGMLSRLNFAFIISMVPISLIGASYSVVSFPVFVEKFNKSIDEFIEIFVKSTNRVVFWSVPLIVVFVLLRAHIVRIILGASNFTWYDVRIVSAVMGVFVLGVLFSGLVMLLNRAYFAMNNTSVPLIGASIRLVVVILFTYLFMGVISDGVVAQILDRFLKIGINNVEILALPLAGIVGVGLHFLYMWFLFNVRVGGLPLKEVFVNFEQVLVGALVMGVSMFVSLRILDNFIELNTFVGVAMHAGITFMVGVLVYFGVLFVMNNEIALGVLKHIKKYVGY